MLLTTLREGSLPRHAADCSERIARAKLQCPEAERAPETVSLLDRIEIVLALFGSLNDHRLACSDCQGLLLFAKCE